MSPYAQRLKYVRKLVANERGLGKLSQAKFAKMLQVHPSPISHIEAGTTRIKPELAKVIEEKTGVRQAWLLTGEGPQRTVAAPPLETRESNSLYGFSWIGTIFLLACQKSQTPSEQRDRRAGR